MLKLLQEVMTYEQDSPPVVTDTIDRNTRCARR